MENLADTTAQTIAQKTKKKTSNWATALFSFGVYNYSVFALVSFWLFLVPNQFLPTSLANMKLYSMDAAPIVPSMLEASLRNVGCMLVFGLTHSFFARKSIKRWMALPESVERSFYCLQSAFFLHMVQKMWAEADNNEYIWDLSTFPVGSTLVLTIFWLGSAITLSATFALDHFHLFGLSQGFGMDLNKMLGLAPAQSDEGGMATRWHYRLVAHPIMSGVMLNCWGAVIMTPTRFVLAIFLTVYMVMAVTHLEEPSLKEELGAAYAKYLKKTPRFVPSIPYKLKLSTETTGLKDD